MVAISGDMLLELYGCAERGDSWRPLLDGLCSALGARSAVAQVFRYDGSRVCQPWTMRDSFSTAHATLHDALVNNESNPRVEPRFPKAESRRLIIRDRDRFGEGCERLAALRQRLHTIGLGEAITMGFTLTADTIFSLTLHRAVADNRMFGGEEEAVLRELAPHFQQMMRLAHTRLAMEGEAAARAAILDRLRTGIMICHPDAQVAWCNEAAVAIVGASPHLSLHAGTLRGNVAADGRRLADALAAARADDGNGARQLLAFGASAEEALHIVLFALPRAPDRCAGEASVALLLSAPGQAPVLVAEEVAALFRLSPAEAALATALVEGHSVNDHAAERGITIGTARVRLKQVLTKLEVHRQSDLVLRLGGSVLAQACRRHH